MKQLWKKFDKLTEICYMSELEDNCPQWDEAYEVFKQLVAQGREKDPQYAAEILKMDDATDFAYGVADWIEDYLDELDAREEHEKLMERCEELLNLFQWQEARSLPCPIWSKMRSNTTKRADGCMFRLM